MTAKRSEEDWNKLFKSIGDLIDDYSYEQIAKKLGFTRMTIAGYVVRGKIKRTRFPVKNKGGNKKNRPVVLMDYGLNIVKRCNSMREMARFVGGSEDSSDWKKFSVSTRMGKLLKDGRVVKVVEYLAVLEEFWNKKGNFNFTRVARNLLTVDVHKDHFIAIIDEDFQLQEVFKGSEKALEIRDGIHERTMYRKIRAAKVIFDNIIMIKSIFNIQHMKRYIYYNDYLLIEKKLNKIISKHGRPEPHPDDLIQAALNRYDKILKNRK